MAAPAARCIVFDFGNVIALFDHLIACRPLASLSRRPLAAEEVYDSVFKTTLEEDYDCGRIGTAAFIARLKDDLALDASDST